MAKEESYVPIVINHREYSEEETKAAAEATTQLMLDSQELQLAITTMIDARRIYMVMRQYVDLELTDRWECTNAALISQAIAATADDMSMQPFEHVEMLDAISSYVVPALAACAEIGDRTGVGVDTDILICSRNYSATEIQHAGGDAAALVADSPTLRVMLIVMSTSRRIYMQAQHMMSNVINNSDGIIAPDLVSRTAEISAENKATEQFSHMELLKSVNDHVIPFEQFMVEATAGQPSPTAEAEQEEPETDE